MAELKTAEGRPVRDASLCPRCRPWPHHARAHPTAAIDLPDQPMLKPRWVCKMETTNGRPIQGNLV